MDTATVEKLEQLFDQDQRAIRDFRSGIISSDELKRLQLEGGKTIRDLIESHGFPFPENATEKAYKAAFLTVLHSPDANLMKKVLLAYESRGDSALRKDQAYLTDKILVFEGKPQLYGTQYKTGTEGSVTFFDTEEPDELDARRIPMGLGTHAEYRDFILDNQREQETA
ncbi:MAG TPA: DUF6624 domain-containing protein [Candidatus Paceibacterota bacterium]